MQNLSKIIMLVFIFSGLLLKAQKQEFIFDKQIYVTTNTILFSPLSLKHNNNKYLKSFPAPCFDVGGGFSEHVYSNYGFNFGVHWGLLPFNIFANFDVSSTDSLVANPDGKIRITNFSYDMEYVYFPLSIYRIKKIKKNKFLNMELGIKYNYIHPYELRVGAWQEKEDLSVFKYFDFYLGDRYQKWSLGFFTKLGFVRLTKKGNTFRSNLLVSYTPQAIGSGYYEFSNISISNSGSVKYRLNFIGIELSYGLTLTKRSFYKN